MSKLGTRLIKAAKEARAFARGEISDDFVVHVPDRVDVKALRSKLKCSQSEFSRRFGFAIDAVQDWEQHRRTPDRTARIFLTVIEREPEAVVRALTRARVSGRRKSSNDPGELKRRIDRGAREA